MRALLVSLVLLLLALGCALPGLGSESEDYDRDLTTIIVNNNVNCGATPSPEVVPFCFEPPSCASSPPFCPDGIQCVRGSCIEGALCADITQGCCLAFRRHCNATGFCVQ